MKQRRPTTPTSPVSGAAPDESASGAVQGCPCPEMEIQINNTPESNDDFVPLHTNQARPEIPCRIRATSAACNARAILSNPDGRLRFPGAGQSTTTISLPDDGSWVAFSISGETASSAARDALIEAHCANGPNALKAHASVTVCALVITSETEQTVPADRARTRLGVEERVTLTATGALGAVSWHILQGSGALSVQTGAQVTYTAHNLEEIARIEASDPAGCKTVIEFDVDCNFVLARVRAARIFSTAPQARLNEITDAFNEFYEDFEINDCLRRAHFFGQVRAEVAADGDPIRERLNYTPDRLRAVFGYYQDPAHDAEADADGRIGPAAHPIRPADQQTIANKVYGNRNGNGNVASGDGWAFRGRGFIQLTFRDNYRAVQNEMDARSPGSGIDIVANPDEARTIRGAMISAMAYWSWRNINAQADGGSANADIDDVTRRINPGSTDFGGRRNKFRNISEPAFHVADCPRVAGGAGP